MRDYSLVGHLLSPYQHCHPSVYSTLLIASSHPLRWIHHVAGCSPQERGCVCLCVYVWGRIEGELWADAPPPPPPSGFIIN